MKVDKEKLIKILKMSKKELIKRIKERKECIVGRECWLWFRREELPCLVAHIDTVYDNPKWHKRPIIFDKEYIWSPEGIGGDDRNGVYILFELFDKLEINCLFTDFEESGGRGAKEACKRFQKELEHTPYFIEVDRRGSKEAVAYNFDENNPEFYKAVAKFFKWDLGSYSDIADLGEHFEVCSVNLSAGFYNEHSKESEYIYIPALEYTLKHIPKLIEALGKKRYKLPDFYHYHYIDEELNHEFTEIYQNAEYETCLFCNGIGCAECSYTGILFTIYGDYFDPEFFGIDPGDLKKAIDERRKKSKGGRKYGYLHWK